MIEQLKIGISDFARERHTPNSGYSYYKGSESELIQDILWNWICRTPGTGRSDLEKVVVVPMKAEKFVGTTATVKTNHQLVACVDRRQPEEDAFIKVKAIGERKTWEEEQTDFHWPFPTYKVIVADPVNFASVVLYSADALLENNGKRSGDYDWEVVAMIASSVENEPMHPLAMARNYLKKPGGTFCEYTAKQFAEAIYFWSNKVQVG